MSVKYVGPLNWQVRIVDKDGRPTPDFIRYFQELLKNTLFLDGAKQDADDDLTGLSALTGQGLVTRTADNTYTVRELEEGANISITNPDGVSGNPIISVTGLTGGGGVFPLTDGAEPPVFITDSLGVIIAVPWSD